MNLKELNFKDNKIKQFEKAGIHSAEDMVRFWPRKYHDRTRITGILPKDQESIFIIRALSIKRGFYAKTVVEVTGVECNTGARVKVVWFNQGFLYSKYEGYRNREVLVCGNVSWNEGTDKYPGYYQVIAPSVFALNTKEELRIRPTYKKIPGMSDEFLTNSLSLCYTALSPMPDTIPESIRKEYDLISYGEMVSGLHWPATQEQLNAAIRRRRWEDLLYFAMRIELENRHCAIGSPFGLPMLKTMRTVQKNLPFVLTEDQEKTLEECIQEVRAGKRLNALVQGDVGCGKTIVALLLMIAFAENGYQAALMAPTQLLAQQHYEGLTRLVASYGLKVAFVSGQKKSKKEQSVLEQGIANGDYALIVGTQALLSSTYQFKELALVIEDEEHKYGVLQRNALAEKAAHGTHTITMSATPIPRTLAQVIYGNRLKLFSIRSKPGGRKPVRTGIAKGMEEVFNWLMTEVNEYCHQAYVVCPMIVSSEKTEGIASVEEVFALYKNELEKYGIKIGVVTGKTKKIEAEDILRSFSNNEISVLISTTVIEVGINVPNATTIAIHNAERFGLAQLHQLRGRVGRGEAPGICVLVSEERENERLLVMCQYTDGFKIAEMDLKQRGAGDLIGSQQSGAEEYLALALAHPEEYEEAQKAATKIMDSGEECGLLERAYSDYKNNIGGKI